MASAWRRRVLVLALSSCRGWMGWAGFGWVAVEQVHSGTQRLSTLVSLACTAEAQLQRKGSLAHLHACVVRLQARLAPRRHRRHAALGAGAGSGDATAAGEGRSGQEVGSRGWWAGSGCCLRHHARAPSQWSPTAHARSPLHRRLLCAHQLGAARLHLVACSAGGVRSNGRSGRGCRTAQGRRAPTLQHACRLWQAPAAQPNAGPASRGSRQQARAQPALTHVALAVGVRRLGQSRLLCSVWGAGRTIAGREAASGGFGRAGCRQLAVQVGQGRALQASALRSRCSALTWRQRGKGLDLERAWQGAGSRAAGWSWARGTVQGRLCGADWG